MAHIIGTAGIDRLFGAAADDLIEGGDERDLLYGGAGNDILRGGDGNDVLRGETGNDQLEGGAGDDSLTSEEQGNDVLLGGDGHDYMFVERRQAGDTLTLDGGAGNDRIIVQLYEAATVSAAGGEGDDRFEIVLAENALALALGAGRDLVILYNLRATIQNGGRIVISDFDAGPDGDIIDLGQFSPTDLTGWNPSTNPFATSHFRATQSGSDVIFAISFTANGVFTDAMVLQNVQLNDLTAENFDGWAWQGTPVAPITLTGTDSGETLRGLSGDDTIEGQGGNDSLDGNAGNDQLYGGSGNDFLRGGPGSDHLYGGADNDNLASDGGDDSLYGEDGNDSLTLSVPFGTSSALLTASGGAGHDSIFLTSNVSTASFAADGGEGHDRIVIQGLAGSATFSLGAGRDVIDLDSWTKPASNTATIEVTDFAAGDGGDRVSLISFMLRNASLASEPFSTGYLRLVQSGADVLLQFDRNGGGDQYVTLINFRNTTASSFTAYNLGGFAPDGAAVAGQTMTGTADADRIFATDGDDIVEGLDSDDILNGFGGDDTLRGGEGNDTLNGSDGDDLLEGGAGNDTFNPGRGEDVVDAGEGHDLFQDNSGSPLSGGNKGFVGGGGDDSVYFSRSNSHDVLIAVGGEGDDYFSAVITGNVGGFLIDGGVGRDTFDVSGNGELTLGSGQDLVRLSKTSESVGVVIHDFETGDLGDRLDFWWLIDSFTNFDRSTNPFIAGHLIVTQSGDDTIIFADVDGTGSATAGYRPVVTLLGIDKHALTSMNLGGYALPFQIGSSADEVFQGTTGDDDFSGGGGNDTFLIGYGGTDYAAGGTGNDIFFVALPATGKATHEVLGREGSDLLQVQGRAGLNDVTIGALAPTGSLIQASGIERIQLLSGFDSSRGWSTGQAVSYRLTLGDGVSAADSLVLVDATGLAAAERVEFSAREADVRVEATGGAANDLLIGGDGNDTLDGGAGNDTFGYFAGGDAQNIDIVRGGAGIDLLGLDFNEAGAALTYSFTANPDGGYDGWIASGPDHRVDFTGIELFDIFGTGTGETIEGGALSDLLSGRGGDDVLIGGGGGDLLDGGAGSDTMRGGAGNDRYRVDALDTVVEFENEGVDQVETALASYTLGDHLERLVGTSSSGQVLTGNALDNFIAGFTGNDTLDGGAGADRMEGGSGHDIYFVDNIGDVIVETGGTDQVHTSLATYALATGLENLVGMVDTGQTLTGNNSSNTIVGAGGGDSLTGGGGADRIFGNGGNDILDGGTLADRMEGGTGDDIYYVDNGADTVVELSGEGFDEVRTSLASTTAAANVEALTGLLASGQTLTGNGLDNRLTGGAGNDWLYGLDGHDVLNGGTGADTLTGGIGDDIYYVDNIGDVVSEAAGQGTDEVRTSLSSYTIGSTIENLTGLLATGQTLTGNSGANLITGGAGSDVIDGGGGDDEMRGGLGDDVFKVNDTGDTAVELAGEGYDQIWSTLASYALPDHVEKLVGASTAGQQLRGNGGDNVIEAWSGADRLLLQDGGDDKAYGGEGGDVFYMGGALTAADLLAGGAGTDVLVLQGDYWGPKAVRLGDFGGIELINLLSGDNDAFGGASASLLSYDLSIDDNDTAPGMGLKINAGTLRAGENFRFDGSLETDSTFYILGGHGLDEIKGGAKEDVFLFAEAGRFGPGDKVDGGGGYDNFVLRGQYTIDFTADGYSGSLKGMESVTLASATDRRFGSPLAGEADYEIVAADDILGSGQVFTWNAGFLASAESFVFDGSRESDGHFRLVGGQGDDEMTGGAGHDLIYGNLGTDILKGNGGSDTFRYDKASESTSAAMDRILAFTGEDVIDLSRIDADDNTDGNQAFSFIGAGPFTNSAGQLRAYQDPNNAGSWFAEADTDGNGTADLVIHIESPGHMIGASDFVL